MILEVSPRFFEILSVPNLSTILAALTSFLAAFSVKLIFFEAMPSPFYANPIEAKETSGYKRNGPNTAGSAVAVPSGTPEPFKGQDD